MTEPDGLATGPDDIRFDRVEPQEGELAAACSSCDRALVATYFEVGGQMVCPGCREVLAAALGRGTPLRRGVRSLAAGLGAAAIGSALYYAVLALTGYEVGLIAIVVGLMVGGAVRWGCHGRGGWAYQGLAVGLTYVAIVSTYVPFLFQAVGDEAASGSAATGAAALEQADGAAAAASAPPPQRGAVPAVATDALTSSTATSAAVAGPGETVTAAALPAAAPDAAPAAGHEEPPMGLGGMVLAMGMFAGFVLALPFLAGFENFIGWFIIGFALFEAWKMNRKRQVAITGPFQIAAHAAAAP